MDMKRRPCRVEISTGAFEHNYRMLSDACGGAAALELLAIVKADAYGHGLELCAPAAVRAGARWLGVTSVEEGVAARELCDGAGCPEILVIGGVFPGQGAEVARHRLTATVWEHWQLDELESAGSEVRVHLELDTGMSRQGAGDDDLASLMARFAAPEIPLRLDGLMTHLYAADESDGAATRQQMARLAVMVERVFAAGLRPAWLHVGNSAAVLAGAVPPALRALCERFGLRPMARPGLALYGLAPGFVPEEPEAVAKLRAQLQRVMEWKTQVVSLRTIEPGDVVGYNATFVATERMRLALLAAGYGDGLKRALGNRGSVLIRGARAPIVGRISMDQTVADVTEIPDVAVGDEAVLIGIQGGETITAEDHAEWAGTIVWEIFTSIACRVERQESVIRKTSATG
jgi:alanine racemase